MKIKRNEKKKTFIRKNYGTTRRLNPLTVSRSHMTAKKNKKTFVPFYRGKKV
jgi:hypothetical protein